MVCSCNSSGFTRIYDVLWSFITLDCTGIIWYLWWVDLWWIDIFNLNSSEYMTVHNHCNHQEQFITVIVSQLLNTFEKSRSIGKSILQSQVCDKYLALIRCCQNRLHTCSLQTICPCKPLPASIEYPARKPGLVLGCIGYLNCGVSHSCHSYCILLGIFASTSQT